MPGIGIYKIQSIVKPDRIYIGSAVDISDRWRCHLRDLRHNKHGNNKFQKHYNKYGQSDLQFSILLGCEKEDLLKIEQYFIDSYNPWFNICKIAGSRLGQKHSEESIIKIRDARQRQPNPRPKGTKISEGTKEKLRKFNLGKIHSMETRKKMSETHKRIGNKPPIRYKKGNIPWNIGLKNPIGRIGKIKKFKAA